MGKFDAYDSISIFVVSTPKMAEFISACAKLNNKIVIADVCCYGQKPRLSTNKDAVVVFEYNTERRIEADAFVSFFGSEHISFVALCSDVKTGFGLLNQGASDMITLKDFSNDIANRRMFMHNLLSRVRSLKAQRTTPDRVLKNKYENPVKKIIAIGSSTGGTEAVFGILKKMPPSCPPILVVQHMPPVFTRLYAERVHKACDISVWEAKDNDKLVPGLALIAPGDKHMTITKRGSEYFVNCFSGEKVGGHCPSVDVLFESIAKETPKNSIGVILTGMGSDGARGLTKMRANGSFTIGQNEESSVVYGMPRVAFELGGVDIQTDLLNIPNEILKRV